MQHLLRHAVRLATAAGLGLASLTPAAVLHAQIGQPMVRRPAMSAGGLAGVRARVRLVADPADPFANDQFSGRLALLDADSVAVTDGERRRAWPRRRVASVEISEGGRNRAAGARRGAVIGAVAGLATSVLLALVEEEGQDAAQQNRTGYTLLFALVFVPLGSGTGAIIGASTSGERWRVVADARDDPAVPVGARVSRLALALPR